MKKYLTSLIILILSIFVGISWGEILEDASGNRFITIGSTKDEVLEILGTPKKINATYNWWYYGYERLSFDRNDRVKEYTNSKALRVLLLPTSQKNKYTDNSINSDSPLPGNSTTNSLKPTGSNQSVSPSSYTTASSGYGEISEKMGRPKTVSVKGYTRKDGTFVNPHYRSAPRRK